MVRRLRNDVAIATARKYGFDLQFLLSTGIVTFATCQTGSHDMVVYRYPTTYAVVITNLDGDTVERFNFK
jgi:hypothetical protein